MFKVFAKRSKSDRADSTIVSTLFVIPLAIAILITIIDVSIFFANRTQINASAREGARTAAIFGGSGTESRQTEIERAYGNKTACADLQVALAGNTNEGVIIPKTPVECHTFLSLLNNNSLISVVIQSVSCSPDFTTDATGGIGSETKCEVKWAYNSVPGSGLSFIKNSEGESPFSTSISVGTSSVEVINVPVTSR